MRTACFMLAMVIGVAGNVEARMYQWTNPASGITQLSGTPPSWYRSARGGPRVFVFEDGQMVDDSAVSVPEYQRVELRALAFGVETAAIGGAGPARATEAGAPPGADAAAAAATAEIPAAAGPVVETAEETVARLKRVLEAWDRQRAADARAIVDQAPALADPRSGPRSGPAAASRAAPDPPSVSR